MLLFIIYELWYQPHTHTEREYIYNYSAVCATLTHSTEQPPAESQISLCSLLPPPIISLVVGFFERRRKKGGEARRGESHGVYTTLSLYTVSNKIRIMVNFRGLTVVDYQTRKNLI